MRDLDHQTMAVRIHALAEGALILDNENTPDADNAVCAILITIRDLSDQLANGLDLANRERAQ